jgi:hypothetical protein
MIKVKVGKFRFKSLIDSGAGISVINYSPHNKELIRKNIIDGPRKHFRVLDANSNEVKVRAFVYLPVRIGEIEIYHEFAAVENFKWQMLLGSDFLSKNCAKINYEENVLQLKSEGKNASAQMIGNERSEKAPAQERGNGER